MVAERTEDLALRGVLPITLGGREYMLATLVANKSDVWLASLSAAVAGLQVIPKPEEDQDGAELFAALLTSSTPAAIALINEYDAAGVLAGLDIGEVATKVEIKSALMAMVTVEDPFGEAAARSAAAAFGERSRLLGDWLASLADEDMLLRLASLTNGASEPTDSTTAPSTSSGPTSSAPSAGRTRKPRKKSA